VRATGAGTCTITASQAGDADWAPAADVITELEIARARQRIELASVPDTVFGAGPQPLSAEAVSGLPVTLTASGPCVIEGGAVRATGAGTCTITASQAGDADWAPAGRVSARMRIERGRQRVELTAPGRARVGGAIDLSAVADSGLPIELDVTGACVAEEGTVRPIGTGTCSITASQPGDDDWAAAEAVTTSVRVGRGIQRIELAAVQDTVFGAEPQPLAAGSESGLPVTFTTSGPCSIDAGRVRATGAGICTVVASQDGDVDWEAATDVRRSFRVARAPQHITFPALDGAYLGQPPLPLGATSDAPLEITYVASGPCVVDGDQLRLLDAGSCTVTAYQPGDEDWAAAGEASQTVEIAAPVDDTESWPPGTVATERPGTLVGPGARITSGFADGGPRDVFFAIALEAGDRLLVDGVDDRAELRISGPGERAWHPFERDGVPGTARWTASDVGIHSVRLRDADAAFGPTDRYTVGFAVERPAGRPATRAMLEQDLLERVTRWSCSTWRATQDPKPFAAGALAAIACTEPVPGVSRVLLFRFADPRRPEEQLDGDVAAAGQGEPGSVPCDAARGPVDWRHGQVACWVEPQASAARLHWTDERTDLYGVMEASDDDLAALYERWARGPFGEAIGS
jgi:hypothetical protein